MKQLSHSCIPDEAVNGIIRRLFGEKSIGNLDVWSFDAEKWDEGRIRLGEMINQAVDINRNKNRYASGRMKRI